MCCCRAAPVLLRRTMVTDLWLSVLICFPSLELPPRGPTRTLPIQHLRGNPDEVRRNSSGSELSEVQLPKGPCLCRTGGPSGHFALVHSLFRGEFRGGGSTIGDPAAHTRDSDSQQSTAAVHEPALWRSRHSV